MYLEKCKLGGKSAFITGAGRGIGLATAEALAAAGVRVMISDIDEGLLASGWKALAAKGFEAATHRLDVANPTAVSAAAERRSLPSARSTWSSPMPASRGRTRAAKT